jgi:hypothetical protein
LGRDGEGEAEVAMTLLTGGCQCGGVRYECEDAPSTLYICHCTQCRRQSASAFGMSLEVRRGGLRLIKGAPRFWTRLADSGGIVRCAFCPDCGTRVWHEGSSDAELITVKAGSLDEPVDASRAIHIWTVSKLDGIVIPKNAVQFPKESI